MNNFADDEFDKLKDVPVQELQSETPESAPDEEGEEKERHSFFRRKIIRIPLRIFMGLLVIGTSVSLYWAPIPKMFDVDKISRVKATTYGHRQLDEALPRGYRTVATTIHLAELLLYKPGGYQSNDWVPMTRIPDNMRSWELGVVVQLRVVVQGLRYELSRSGPLAGELKELNLADARFNYDHTRWMLQSTESQYKQGVEYLETYLDKINASTTPGKYFTTRQDQVIDFIGRQQKMLGTYTTNLQKNIGDVRFDTSVLTQNIPDNTDDTAMNTSVLKTQIDYKNIDVSTLRERDNVFYEARGGLFVMYHVMLALRKDCESILNDTNSMGVMNRIVNELEGASKPMLSPIVLNGSEYGAVQNHSLILVGHVAKAHYAMKELQRQMAGGGKQN